MIESTEYAVRLAVLQHPEAFGLKDEDVNPFISYALIMIEDGEDIIDIESVLDDCVVEVERTLDSKVHLILSGRAEMPELPEKPKNGQTEKPDKGNASSKNHGSKISNKQLRYIGYLHHQLGRKPDYKEVSTLTQRQATMRIKDLEKELSESK